MFTKFYNVLSPEEQFTCLNFLSSPGWEFSGNSNTNDFVFWYKELIQEEFFSSLFFNRVCEVTERKFIINRLYANGQTHGQPGSLHIDDQSDDSWTFVYYANPYWEIQWGGSTVFYQNNQMFDSCIFVPNMGILFKSNIQHAGLEPTNHFKGLRMTVAFKLKEVK